MKMINKDALVAEIKERIETYNKGYANGDDRRADALEVLLHDINTLEMKEVDLDGEIKEEYLKRRCCGGRDNMLVILSEPQFNKIAKYFFELGLKAKDWEKERMEECPYRQVGCTMYEGKILECRGACSWVVDYPKLKEFKVQKGE